MSFNIDFSAASAADAIELIDAAHAPASIKEFLRAAVKADIGRGVQVKCDGHLFSGDDGNYTVSTARIEVRPITFQKLKKD